jgi:hypothetical protein
MRSECQSSEVPDIALLCMGHRRVAVHVGIGCNIIAVGVHNILSESWSWSCDVTDVTSGLAPIN